MIAIILLGLLAMSACLALQAASLLGAVRYFAWSSRRPRSGSPLRQSFLQLAGLMISLMLGNIVQIIIWATIYRLLGGFDDIETAVYFSGVTFTTLGYGDVVLKGRIRQLAPLQAANGVMMFGLSTAALFVAVEKLVGRWTQDRNLSPPTT